MILQPLQIQLHRCLRLLIRDSFADKSHQFVYGKGWFQG
jgi:hypothetical protein